MRQFKLKAGLASKLSHNLQSLPPQTVASVLGGKPSAAVRQGQKVARKLEEQNKEYLDLTKSAADQMRAWATPRLEKFKKDKAAAKDDAAQSKLLADYQREWDEKSAEYTKIYSSHYSDVVSFEIGNDDYDKVLLPLFEATSDMWVGEDGKKMQENFLEVADALEGIEPEGFDSVLRTDNKGNA